MLFFPGGAIRSDQRDFISLNCTFSSCYSSGSGGAIGFPINNEGEIECEDCLFEFCTSGGITSPDENGCFGDGGGAIHCTSFSCIGCTFACCTAFRGGAISASRLDVTGDISREIFLSKSQFISCSSDSDGGAIDIRRYNFRMEHCGLFICFTYLELMYFKGMYYNKGTGFGAFCVEARYSVIIDDNVFVGNYKIGCKPMEKGAALVIWLDDEFPNSVFDLSVKNCYFSKNNDINCNQGNDLGTGKYYHHLEAQYFIGSCSISPTPRIACFFFFFFFYLYYSIYVLLKDDGGITSFPGFGVDLLPDCSWSTFRNPIPVSAEGEDTRSCYENENLLDCRFIILITFRIIIVFVRTISFSILSPIIDSYILEITINVGVGLIFFFF
jgi:hypothetical protein